MVNINIEIPDDIHKKLRILSVSEEISLKDLIIKSLEEGLHVKK